MQFYKIRAKSEMHEINWQHTGELPQANDIIRLITTTNTYKLMVTHREFDILQGRDDIIIVWCDILEVQDVKV